MGMVIAEHDSYVNTVICQSFQCDSVYGGESAIIYQRLYLDLIGLMNDIFVPPTGWEPRRDLMNYWQMLTPRAREEIELYEKCLPRLQRAWQDNGPHQFGGALNEAIDDIETLARTTVVLEVEVRLLALLQLMLGTVYGVQQWRKVRMMILQQKLSPPLEWLDRRAAA